MWTGVESNLQFGGTEIPSDCPGSSWTNSTQYACSWPLQVYIAFPKPFKFPPTVLVTSLSLWTDLTPCTIRFMGPSGYYEGGSAMDAQIAFAASVTTAGFWLRAGSSLENGVCSGDTSTTFYWTPNVISWSATGVKK